MANAKTKREDRVEGFGRRVDEHGTKSMALAIPDGMNFLQTKKDVAMDLEFIPYVVSEESVKFKENWARPGKKYVERTYFVHYQVGPDKDTVVCLARTCGKRCPICEYRNKLAEDPKNENAVKKLYAKERQLWLVYNHAEASKGLQLWEIAFFNFGKQLQQKIKTARPDKRAMYELFYDLEDGMTVRVTNVEESPAPESGAKPFLKFSIDEFSERSEESKETVAKLFKKAPCLDDIPVMMSYEDIKDLFFQIDKAGDEDETEGSPTRNGKAETASKKQDDDDPDDTTDDDDDENKEEKAEEKEEGVEWEKGMEVSFSYKSKTYTGTIIKVDAENDIARVEVEGIEKAFVVDLDDLTLVDPRDEDEKPKNTAKGGKPTGRPSRR